MPLSRALPLLHRLSHNYLRINVVFKWHDVHQRNVDTFKEALTHAPVLVFLDYGLPFTVFTDASSLGIGVVLMQQGDGVRLYVIACG